MAKINFGSGGEKVNYVQQEREELIEKPVFNVVDVEYVVEKPEFKLKIVDEVVKKPQFTIHESKTEVIKPVYSEIEQHVEIKKPVFVINDEVIEITPKLNIKVVKYVTIVCVVQLITSIFILWSVFK
jgi:hypothetical protein